MPTINGELFLEELKQAALSSPENIRFVAVVADLSVHEVAERGAPTFMYSHATLDEMVELFRAQMAMTLSAAKIPLDHRAEFAARMVHVVEQLYNEIIKTDPEYGEEE